MLLISRPNTILGEACCLRITDPLVAYMDANNGTDASVSAAYARKTQQRRTFLLVTVDGF
jgi:hypothetical protein